MKPFCYYHVRTVDNPGGTDCSAHLAEGRCFQCPYTSFTEAIQHSCEYADELQNEIKPNKFNETMSTSNHFINLRGYHNPFVK